MKLISSICQAGAPRLDAAAAIEENTLTMTRGEAEPLANTPIKGARNLREAADFLKVLGNESRLAILCSLSEREKSVSEIEADLHLRQPTISQQLARLRMEGLVSARREGHSVHYRIANADVATILAALATAFCK